MLNITSFKSLTIRCKILGNMRRAMTKGYPQYITNRKGKSYLRVERVSTKTSLNGRAFQFFDTKQRDITELVYKALRA